MVPLLPSPGNRRRAHELDGWEEEHGSCRGWCIGFRADAVQVPTDRLIWFINYLFHDKYQFRELLAEADAQNPPSRHGQLSSRSPCASTDFFKRRLETVHVHAFH